MTSDDPTDERELAGDLSTEALESLDHAAGSAAGQAVKAEAKAAKKERKRQKKDTKKAAKAAAKDARRAVENGQEPPELAFPAQHSEGTGPRMTPQRARNAINVGRVVLPAVIPVLLPYAIRAATAAREAFDRFQARRLGTDVESLGEYSGPGAALHIRISGLSQGLGRLDSTDAAAQEFAESTSATLRQLSSAVQAADTMPAARRREAHRAVSAELDELEARLLRHLGVG